MITFDAFKAKKIKRNPNWPQIPIHMQNINN